MTTATKQPTTTPAAPPTAPAKPLFAAWCAICLRHPTATYEPAVTNVNGTSVCEVHCQHAPPGALPYPDEP